MILVEDNNLFGSIKVIDFFEAMEEYNFNSAIIKSLVSNNIYKKCHVPPYELYYFNGGYFTKCPHEFTTEEVNGNWEIIKILE